MEAIALVGVCVMIVLLARWLLAHDGTPGGKTGGLFALQEPVDVPVEQQVTYRFPNRAPPS